MTKEEFKKKIDDNLKNAVNDYNKELEKIRLCHNKWLIFDEK